MTRRGSGRHGTPPRIRKAAVQRRISAPAGTRDHRRDRPRKRLGPHGSRGFRSHSLRHERLGQAWIHGSKPAADVVFSTWGVRGLPRAVPRAAPDPPTGPRCAVRLTADNTLSSARAANATGSSTRFVPRITAPPSAACSCGRSVSSFAATVDVERGTCPRPGSRSAGRCWPWVTPYETRRM